MSFVLRNACCLLPAVLVVASHAVDQVAMELPLLSLDAAMICDSQTEVPQWIKKIKCGELFDVDEVHDDIVDSIVEHSTLKKGVVLEKVDHVTLHNMVKTETAAIKTYLQSSHDQMEKNLDSDFLSKGAPQNQFVSNVNGLWDQLAHDIEDGFHYAESKLDNPLDWFFFSWKVRTFEIKDNVLRKYGKDISILNPFTWSSLFVRRALPATGAIAILQEGFYTGRPYILSCVSWGEGTDQIEIHGCHCDNDGWRPPHTIPPPPTSAPHTTTTSTTTTPPPTTTTTTTTTPSTTTTTTATTPPTSTTTTTTTPPTTTTTPSTTITTTTLTPPTSTTTTTATTTTTPSTTTTTTATTPPTSTTTTTTTPPTTTTSPSTTITTTATSPPTTTTTPSTTITTTSKTPKTIPTTETTSSESDATNGTPTMTIVGASVGGLAALIAVGGLIGYGRSYRDPVEVEGEESNPHGEQVSRAIEEEGRSETVISLHSEDWEEEGIN